MHKRIRVAWSFLLLITVPFSSLLYAVEPVYAANVASYIDLTADGGTNNPATVTTPPELAISTADEFFISYVTSATQFAAANTVSIQVPTTFTSLALCGTSTTDADGDTTTDGALTLNGTTFTYTFTQATTLAATSGVEFCFAATTPSSVGNYSVAIIDDNDTDSSAALIYVGDDNDVLVTATVPVSMSLRIKEPSTTADTNACQLGVLNPASVNTCAYRIAAGTSHGAGMAVQIVGDDQLNLAAPTTDIDDINTATNETIDAGIEEYGAYVSAAGTGFTIQNDFNDYEDIPTTADAEAPQTILNATGAIDDSSTTTWSTVTHGASINTATSGGSYTQVITIRAFANV